MATRKRLARKLSSLVLGLGLLSLVFMGNAGCGCGDDDLGPTHGTCCCDYEWIPSSRIIDRDIRLVLDNTGSTLGATVSPTLLTSVNGGVPEEFTLCVRDDHAINDTLEVALVDDATNVEYGRVRLYYDEPCLPTILPLTGGILLTSPNCGGEPTLCCCLFEWLPNVDHSGDVAISAQNVSTGLGVQITPGQLTGVTPREFETFTVCVNADHELLDGFDLVMTGTGDMEIGRMRVIYRTRCEPHIAAIPDVTPLLVTSTECGGAPLLCCCDIQWDVFWDGTFPGVTASLENVDDVLGPATITPEDVPTLGADEGETFTVCVSPTHVLNATLDIVLRDPTGAEVARVPLNYYVNCRPGTGESSGAGTWYSLCEAPN